MTMIVSNGALIRSEGGPHASAAPFAKANGGAGFGVSPPRVREGAAVIFDRQRENQLIARSLDPG